MLRPTSHVTNFKSITIYFPRPPPPTPIEPVGTYARSPSLEPPYLGYWLPLEMTKTPPFPGFLGKSSRDYTAKKYPLSRENVNAHEPPLCIRVHGAGLHPRLSRSQLTSNRRCLIILHDIVHHLHNFISSKFPASDFSPEYHPQVMFSFSPCTHAILYSINKDSVQ